MADHWIPDDEWKVIVQNAPIVSVDLVVETGEGVVLGRRANEPAKDQWFVPGGRVLKGEGLRDAVHRIAEEEIGISGHIREQLGVYEHHYEASDVADSEGKHYVAIGYVVETDAEQFDADDQHDELLVFEPSALPTELHEYVSAYLRDADILPVDSDR